MGHTDTELALDEPASYEIWVNGHLGERWVDYVQGLTISYNYHGEDQHAVTVLTGILSDQAALFGVITFLYAVLLFDN